MITDSRGPDAPWGSASWDPTGSGSETPSAVEVVPRRGRPWRRLGTVVVSVAVIIGTAGGGALAMTWLEKLSVQPGTVPSASPRDAWDFAADGDPGTDPGSDPAYGSGAAGSSRTVGDASPVQSVGLVEITSSLVNGRAAGTGLVWSSSGIIVTNHHVVEGATSVKVRVVSTGQTFTATYVGADVGADVAVLRLDGASGLQPVDPAVAARAGDAVTAVGDANGDGGSLTAATGTVLATGRDIVVQDDRGRKTARSNLVEISADVVPGDSGGAVLDARGDVVAMTVAAATGGVDVAGYAIPITTVQSIVGQVLAGVGTPTIHRGYHGYLGVSLDPSATVPLVERTIGRGAAERAGMSAGDTVTAVGRQAVSSADQLRTALAGTTPGTWLRVSWRTGAGTTRTATVLLGRAPID